MSVSPYPFERLPKLTKREAGVLSSLARWLAAKSVGERLARLVGGPVRGVRIASGGVVDPQAASCVATIAGVAIAVRGSSAAVRRVTQKLLGGPAELPAPRPLTVVEQAIWSLVVATACEDLGIAADVWPQLEAGALAADAIAIDVIVDLGELALTATAFVPRTVLVQAGPARPAPAWAERAMIEVPIVLGRCAITAGSIATLAVRDVITLERPHGVAELVLLGGAIGLSAMSGAVVAEVATEYVRGDMSLPDDAHVELTVALGTTQLSLRAIFELSVGQIVQLGRPLAGPFELRAANRVVGKGELVDVDGELGVRILSLAEK